MRTGGGERDTRALVAFVARGGERSKNEKGSEWVACDRGWHAPLNSRAQKRERERESRVGGFG